MNKNTLNKLLVENVQDVGLVNKFLSLGADNTKGALIGAIKGKYNDSIIVLKLLVTNNEGLLAATVGNSVEMLEYFMVATNYEECCNEASIRNYVTIYDLLKNKVSANCAMKCATYLSNITDIETFKNNGADNYNDCMLIASKLENYDIVVLMLSYGANNNNECLRVLSTDKFTPVNIKKILLGMVV